MFGLSITWLDLVIAAVFLFYAYEGYVLGFILASADLLSFVISFIAALKLYPFVAKVLMGMFALPIGFANACGFFLSAFVVEVTVSLLFRYLFRRTAHLFPLHPLTKFLGKLNQWLGIFPGILSSFIILSFLLTLIVSLPSSPFIKQFVTGSLLGEKLVANTSLFEKKLDAIFGGALDETLNFMTVKPQSNESVALHFTVKNGTVDEEAEQEMFRLVNQERLKAGLAPVFFDTALTDIARAHSADMFARGYFSHYSPEGESPFDRMSKADIEYVYAGENLALAPTTKLAMQGLMNSPGHRANILKPQFTKIGIGVMDGGIYGKMYSQEFTN